MTRVWEKIERLKKLPDLSISDFGTRRRHGFLWQDWCVQAMMEGSDRRSSARPTASSPCARRWRPSARTPMSCPWSMRPSTDSDEELAEAPYDVLADWQQDYEGNLRVILPDTYGTTNFLRNAPDWVRVLDRHSRRFEGSDRGRRGGHRLVAPARAEPEGEARDLLRRARCRRDRAHPSPFPRPHAHRLWLGHASDQRFPWARPRRQARSDLIVCKVISADGRPAVKLSDNPTKAMGPRAEIERYKRVFHVGEQAAFLNRFWCADGACMRVDLNCDMGEGFGPWPMGDDEAMLDIVSSANIACGFHAGDPSIMFRTAEMAKRKGVAIGAHPGFNDLHGLRPPRDPRRFTCRDRAHGRLPDRRHAGRRFACGARGHLCEGAWRAQQHGQRGRGAWRSPSPAPSRASTATSTNVCMPGLLMERLPTRVGVPVAREIFADRTYEDDGTLTEPEEAGFGSARCRICGRAHPARRPGPRHHDGVRQAHPGRDRHDLRARRRAERSRDGAHGPGEARGERR